MNRRDFIALATKSVAAAIALPTIPLPTVPAASAAAAPVFDASLTWLFANWMNAARLMFDERMPEIIKDKPLTAHNYQRVLRAVDNSKKSWRTRIPAEHENHPAMKAMLDIYDAEMQCMRSITEGKPADYVLTPSDLETVRETVRVSWDSFVQIAQRYPELQEIANNIHYKNQAKADNKKDDGAQQSSEQKPVQESPEKLDTHAANVQTRKPNWDLLSSDTMQVYEDINRALDELTQQGSDRGGYGR